MTFLKRTPVLRTLYRYWSELTRPAPLSEFQDYDDYWHSRVRDGKRSPVLDRYRIVAGLVPDHASVLDIGCGEGAFLRYLGAAKPSCRIAGADISSVAIDALAKDGIDGRLIDPDKPLATQIEGAWDAIVLMEVIEHVVDAEALMRDVASLSPRRVFVTIPNVGFLLHRFRLMFFGRFPVTSIFYHMKEHVRFWTLKDFQQWASHVGMHVHSYHGQVDRPDMLVRLLARAAPGLFADRMVYELSPVREQGAASRTDPPSVATAPWS